jgi:hypothetical protein
MHRVIIRSPNSYLICDYYTAPAAHFSERCSSRLAVIEYHFFRKAVNTGFPHKHNKPLCFARASFIYHCRHCTNIRMTPCSVLCGYVNKEVWHRSQVNSSKLLTISEGVPGVGSFESIHAEGLLRREKSFRKIAPSQNRLWPY